MSVLDISLLSVTLVLSSDSSSDSVSSSVVVSVSSSFGGGGVGVDLFKKRLWKGFASLAPAEETLERAVSGVPSMLPRARIFCFTSSVVYAAPVVRIALEDPADDSVDVLDSELAERAVFLWVASEGLRVVAGVLLAGVFFVCRAVTDSSDSSALDKAWRKHCVSCVFFTHSSCIFTHKTQGRTSGCGYLHYED